MNTNGGHSPACRELRQLLGVYVVGAIDPAERNLVDQHLTECQACRDELAGLAGLPAMLSRVPAADVARLAGPVISLPDRAEPSPELLNSLLSRVASRRKARMWRGVAASAAAAVIAIAGTTAVFELTSGTSAPRSEVASSANPQAGVAALVDYSPAFGGTAMRVQVSGIKPGTTCWFWVLTKSGHWSEAGQWTVGGSGWSSPQHWYSASSSVPPNAVRAFQITSGSKVLVTIPAA
jgi:anti-sigma-K factor RskA